MNTRPLLIFFTGLTVLAGCAAPVPQSPATPTFLSIPTSTLFPGTPPTLPLSPGPGTLPAGTPEVSPSAPANICANPAVLALLDSFKKAILTSDGTLLSSLVSPARGMDVAYFRDGTVITYQPEHARFLFETTFEVDWGTEPGSGAAKQGSFHDVVVPELVGFLGQPYTLHCNELKHGGATYVLEWPYQSEFYSMYFPGTQANGNLDWQTWVVGIEYVAGRPAIYGLIRFFWEP